MAKTATNTPPVTSNRRAPKRKHLGQHHYLELGTPTGLMTLVVSGNRIVEATWRPVGEIQTKYEFFEKNERHPLLSLASAQLREYFAGKRKIFELPFELRGTPFQKKVWQELGRIPFAETRSYQQIAIQIGMEKACRAVGLANSQNPLAIFYPCHRVIGKNGKLTGFAGGLGAKQMLLELENSRARSLQ